MKTYRPVSVSNGAFVFCRVGIAALVWVAFLFQVRILLVLVFIFFVASVLLRVKKSPMIFLYEKTIDKLFPAHSIMLDEHAMRFAHGLGALLSAVCLVILFGVSEKAGWIAVGIFAILKTISAMGFCPASKIYTCLASGGCCAISDKTSKRC